MDSRVLTGLLVVCAVLFGAVTAVHADEPIVIRFSHVVTESAPKGIGANRFKELAEARLPGRVRVEVYPASRRFTDEEVPTALLFDDIQLAAPSFVQLRAYAPELQVFDLPFLFEDVDHLHRFQQSAVGQQLLQVLLPRQLVGLGYWDSGMRVLSADRPIRVPSDISGLRIRVEPSHVFHDQYARLGAVSYPLPFARLADAIRDGLVDAQENSWSNIYSRGIHRLHRHFTPLDHSFLGYMVISSVSFWQSLPGDVRAELEAILREVSVEVNAIARDRAQTDRQRSIDEAGIEVVTPTDAEMTLWREAWKPVWDRYAGEIGDPILEAALAAAASR
jgi:C4-dicarboxylate-binding protein DctP